VTAAHQAADPTGAPVAPSWLGPIEDPEHPAAAILVAAAELFQQRSPSSVSLREIARRADVNYGLIHHYYGTKDAILAELLRRASAAGAARMRDSVTIDDALVALTSGTSRSTHAQMLAWALLDGVDPAKLVEVSPAIARLTELIAAEQAHGRAAPDGPGDGAPDPRVVAATAVSAILGWQFFRPFVTAIAGLDDSTETSEDVIGLLRTMVLDFVHGTPDAPTT
jgi:AcrR family transcriptional regulator